MKHCFETESQQMSPLRNFTACLNDCRQFSKSVFGVLTKDLPGLNDPNITSPASCNFQLATSWEFDPAFRFEVASRSLGTNVNPMWRLWREKFSCSKCKEKALKRQNELIRSLFYFKLSCNCRKCIEAHWCSLFKWSPSSWLFLLKSSIFWILRAIRLMLFRR